MFIEEGVEKGWRIVKESEEDTVTMERIREMQFLGIGGEFIEYGGRRSAPDSDATIELRFIKRKYN